MNHILLDTNILMAVVQFKIDIFSELSRICDFSYDISILNRTIGELKIIKSQQKGKNRLAASIAIHIVEKQGIHIIKTMSEEPVDDLIASFSKQGYIIATQDMGLKKKLMKPYITMRKKEYLMIVN